MWAGSLGHADLAAGGDHQPLQRTDRHGRLRAVHALGHQGGIAGRAPAHVGEEPVGIAVELPLPTQIFEHLL